VSVKSSTGGPVSRRSRAQQLDAQAGAAKRKLKNPNALDPDISHQE